MQVTVGLVVFRTQSRHLTRAPGNFWVMGTEPGKKRGSTNVFLIYYGGVRKKIILGPREGEGWAVYLRPEHLLHISSY